MKQNLLQKIETYFIVTVVTALIWLYAEGATVKTDKVTFEIQFVPVGTTPLIISPESATVKIAYKCRKDVIEQVRRLAEQPLIIKVNENTDILILKDRLMADDSPLASLGINLLDDGLEPSTIDLNVEPLVIKPVPVQIDPGSVQLVSAPTLEPLTIDVQMPKSGKPPELEVRMDQIEDLDSLPVNQDITRDLLVEIPIYSNKTNITLLQNQVKVTFRIASQDESYTIDRVPVYLTVPPSKLKEFDVILSDEYRFLRDVQVTGPSDSIELIRSKQITLHADLRLTPEQMAQNEEVFVSPTINLPQGVVLNPLPQALPVKIIRKPNGNGLLEPQSSE